MTAGEIEIIQQAWSTLAPILAVPHTQHAYERLVGMLDSLIDVVGEDEEHPLASLMEVIGVLIEKYEDQYASEVE